jgi:hypothetical protein
MVCCCLCGWFCWCVSRWSCVVDEVVVVEDVVAVACALCWSSVMTRQLSSHPHWALNMAQQPATQSDGLESVSWNYTGYPPFNQPASHLPANYPSQPASQPAIHSFIHSFIQYAHLTGMLLSIHVLARPLIQTANQISVRPSLQSCLNPSSLSFVYTFAWPHSHILASFDKNILFFFHSILLHITHLLRAPLFNIGME